jgi:tripartite-type tricarboxylate transporter receptor subunit TctC
MMKLSGLKGVTLVSMLVSILAALLGAANVARAQDFPNHTVTLVVPNAPGGSIDILARLFSKYLQAQWRQSVVVIYKPGAGTAVGTEFVARSAPDGHTIGMVVTSHVINPSLRPNLPFNTVKDLAGVTMTAVSHIVIEATPSLPINTLPELIAYAKTNPGKLTYASPGSGSAMHLAGELLKTKAGIDMVHVPYKGSGPAYPDVFSGRVDLLIDPLYASKPYIDAGRMKALAITSLQRAKTAPDIPTVADTVPGFNVQSINGIVVPKATPRAIVHKLNADLIAVLNLAEMRARLSELGLEVVVDTPEEFDDYIRTEIDKWAEVVRISGAKAE